MNKKRTRNFILGFFAISVIFGGVYAYRAYNRKNITMDTAKPQFVVSAAELTAAFEKDEKAAFMRYGGKVVDVNGICREINQEDSSSVTVVLGNSGDSAAVRITMDSSFSSNLKSLGAGKPLSVRAVCTGYHADDMGLGADVLMNRGVIIK